MNVFNLNDDTRRLGLGHCFTKHASVRMQQRGIPPVAVEAAINFGTRNRLPDGHNRFNLDRKALKRSSSYFGQDMIRALKRYDGLYVVVSIEGVVVTTAYRH